MPSISDEEFDKKLWKIVDRNIPKTVTHKGQKYYISKNYINDVKRQTNKRWRHISINSNSSRYCCCRKCCRRSSRNCKSCSR